MSPSHREQLGGGARHPAASLNWESGRVPALLTVSLSERTRGLAGARRAPRGVCHTLPLEPLARPGPSSTLQPHGPSGAIRGHMARSVSRSGLHSQAAFSAKPSPTPCSKSALQDTPHPSSLLAVTPGTHTGHWTDLFGSSSASLGRISAPTHPPRPGAFVT